MSAQAHRGTLDPPALAPVPGERQRRRLIPWLLTAVVVLAGAGAGLAVSGPFSAGGTSQPGAAGNATVVVPESVVTCAFVAATVPGHHARYQPFTTVAPGGPEEIFPVADVDDLVARITSINRNAQASAA